jgi:hypothetical protein
MMSWPRPAVCRPGCDDRASFTTTLNTARDQIVHAAGVTTDTVIGRRSYQATTSIDIISP